MSLINEALKKAQRQRSDHPPGSPAGSAGGFEPRVQANRTQSIVLIAAGAAVLVVCSVGLTIYLVNRPPPVAPEPVVAAAPVQVSTTATADSPSPVIIAPVTATPAVVETPVAPDPAAPVPAPEITPVAAPTTPELAIQLWVDAIRVMGIRSSGGESKVLMNDRVYRVNDIVDRTLVVKLVKVEPEMLTFTDTKGAIYTKSF